MGWGGLTTEEQQVWRTEFTTNADGRFGVVTVPDGGWTSYDQHQPLDRNMASPTGPAARAPRRRKSVVKFEHGDVRATGKRVRATGKRVSRSAASPGSAAETSESQPVAERQALFAAGQHTAQLFTLTPSTPHLRT